MKPTILRDHTISVQSGRSHFSNQVLGFSSYQCFSTYFLSDRYFYHALPPKFSFTLLLMIFFFPCGISFFTPNLCLSPYFRALGTQLIHPSLANHPDLCIHMVAHELRTKTSYPMLTSNLYGLKFFAQLLVTTFYVRQNVLQITYYLLSYPTPSLALVLLVTAATARRDCAHLMCLCFFGKVNCSYYEVRTVFQSRLLTAIYT